MGEQKYFVELGEDGIEEFDSLGKAVDTFDYAVQQRQDESTDGWREDAEYSPALYVAYPLRTHGLNTQTVEDLEAKGDTDGAERLKSAGWDYFADSRITEYADPVAVLTAERDAAQDTAAQAIADFDRVVRERDEARTEASHLRSRCAAYEAALGEDHADTVRDRDEAREALANAVEILNCVADQVTPFAYDEIRSVLDSEPGALRAERDQARAQRDAAIARRDAALDRVFDLLRGMLSADDLSRVQEAARLGDVERGEP
jgi:hypothetical protein